VVKSLIGAIINQSRFKPSELVLATTDPSASRWLIAPDRSDAAPGEPQLASGPLGGFAGFLDRRLRHHDFMLGRANCQGFLRDHFRLPSQNPIFVGNGAAQAAPDGTMLPVIPLCGSANDPIAVPSWPKIPQTGLDRIEALIAKRVAKVLPHLLATLYVSRFVAFLIHMIKSRGWVKRIRNTIQQQLKVANLIE
jgi:hypothetical protein